MEEQKIEKQPEKEMIFPSRKMFRKSILPVVGEKIGNWKIIYVHDTKMRFTASGLELPQPAQHMAIDGRVFQVEYVDEKKHRFNAQFIGFEKPAEQTQPPVNLDSPEVAKLL